MSENHVLERWRRPLKILAAEHDPDSGVRWDRQGWREGVSITTDQDGYDRLRNGTVCIQCYEPQPEPFPEECMSGWCGYRIRAEQPQRFEHEFQGEKHLGGSTSLSDELARLDEFEDRFRWEQNPTTGIVLPRGIH